MLLAWPEVATAELLAAILLWRGVYYGAPLALALLLLADALAEGPAGRPLARLARRLRRRPPPPAGASDRDRVAWILDENARAEGALALLGDKRFAFSPCGRAFLMYGVRGRRWIAMGDPHGPEAAWAPLWSAFREEARRAGAKTSVYKAEAAAFWRAQGLRPQIVGEEAILDPRAFSLAGRKRRELRRKCGQAERAGLSVTACAPHEAPMEALAEISAEWSARRRERSFSTGHFDPDYLAKFPIFAAWLDGRCVAFVSVWVSGDGSEHALDLMRHTADAPQGAMHALVVAAIEAAGAAGAARFSLCMAPLSGLGRAEKGGRALSRLLALVYLRGEKAHGFRGLRRFKESFRPEWRPRYVVANSQAEALATLLAVRGLSRAPGAGQPPLRTAKIIPWERGAWLRRAARPAEDAAARRKAG
jgi:phosphatidylglycerol lysyltransferase